VFKLCQPDQEGEWPPIQPKIENNALIVLPGARIADAVSAGAWGAFLHQRQICMTSGRHLVHESLHAEYVAALADKADKLPVGDPAAGPVALDLIIEAGREFARSPGAEPAAGSGLSGSPWCRSLIDPLYRGDRSAERASMGQLAPGRWSAARRGPPTARSGRVATVASSARRAVCGSWSGVGQSFSGLGDDTVAMSRYPAVATGP
jgi:hypothetical protein